MSAVDPAHSNSDSLPICTSGYTKSRGQKAVITLTIIPNTIIALICLIFLWVVCTNYVLRKQAWRVMGSRGKLKAGMQLYGCCCCCCCRGFVLFGSYLWNSLTFSNQQDAPSLHLYQNPLQVPGHLTGHLCEACIFNLGWKYFSSCQLGSNLSYRPMVTDGRAKESRGLKKRM